MASEFKTVIEGDFDASMSRVPVSERISPEYFALEKERVFRTSWLPLTFTYGLEAAGSFKVVEVPTFKTKLLVTRGQDGKLRAFHNICRHRGNELVQEIEGCKRLFSCSYHGWSFNEQGELKGVPDESEFVNLDKSKLGLLEVAAEAWEDLLFVNFAPQPAESLRQWLGDWYGSCTGYFAGREMIANYEVDLAANWNVAINAFTEGYHTLWVHPDTLPDYQGGKANKMRHRPYLELGRLHSLYSAHANLSRVPTPVERAVYGRGLKLFPSFDVDFSHVPPGINPSNFEEWAYDMREFVPHTCLLGGAYFHILLQFWPVTHERTVMRVQTFSQKAERPSHRLAQALYRVRNREVAREDVATIERTNKALQSGVLPFAVLSNQELLLQHHYRVIDALVSGIPSNSLGSTSAMSLAQ